MIIMSIGAGAFGLANAYVDCRIIHNWSTAAFLAGEAIAAGIMGSMALLVTGTGINQESGVLFFGACLAIYAAGWGNIWIVRRCSAHQVVFLQQLRPLVALGLAAAMSGTLPSPMAMVGLGLLIGGTMLFTSGGDATLRISPAVAAMLLLTLGG